MDKIFIRGILKKYGFGLHKVVLYLLLRNNPGMAWITRNKVYDWLYTRHINEVIVRTKVPAVLTIETTSICNAKCVMCPNRFMKRKKMHMSDEVYKKIIDEFSKYKQDIKEIQLNLFGDPLVDAKIEERTKYAKDKFGNGTRVAYYSNGGLLTKERAKKILETGGLDFMAFSFHGTNKEDYEKTMSIDYERTKSNILYFLKLKKEMKLEKPFVNMNYVLSDANDSKKIVEIKKFWLSHGINRFETSIVDKWWNDSESSSKHRVELKKNKKYPCPAIWNGVYFASDGRVALCCSRDYEVSFGLGDINTDSAEQVLNNALKDYCKMCHRRGNFDNISICGDCEGLDKTYYSWWVY